MEKNKEAKTRKHQIVVSKLIYLEARRIAEKHNVFWSRIRVTGTGDPFDGDILIEFRAKTSKEELIQKDLDYLHRLNERILSTYNEGKRQLYS